MKTNLNVTDLSDYSVTHELVELASFCPCCNKGLNPDIISACLIPGDDEEDNIIYTFNYCSSCDSCFISRHEYDFDTSGYNFIFSAPHSKSTRFFSDNIKSLSPQFIEIYTDSLTAENTGLTSICGMGYRKALEFLVKDYAILKNPNESDSIKKKLCQIVYQTTFPMSV
jgi:hypothetical protein